MVTVYCRSFDGLTAGNCHRLSCQVGSDVHGSDHYPIYLTAKETSLSGSLKKSTVDTSDFASKVVDILYTASYVESILASEKLQKYPSLNSDGYYKAYPVPWYNNECEPLNPEVPNKIEYEQVRGMSNKMCLKRQKSPPERPVSSIMENTSVSAMWRFIK